MPDDIQFADNQQDIENFIESDNSKNNEVLSEIEPKSTNEPEAQITSQKQLKEIAKLHRECAKYRTALNSSNDEKASLEKLFQNLKADFESVSKQKRIQEVLYKLENAGCLKSSLVLNDIPEDCENLDEFLLDYKKNNPFLFKKQKTRHGFAFRGGQTTNYTSSQQMNNYIRSALGR